MGMISARVHGYRGQARIRVQLVAVVVSPPLPGRLHRRRFLGDRRHGALFSERKYGKWRSAQVRLSRLKDRVRRKYSTVVMEGFGGCRKGSSGTALWRRGVEVEFPSGLGQGFWASSNQHLHCVARAWRVAHPRGKKSRAPASREAQVVETK